MTRNKLFALLLAACAAGFSWLAITYNQSVSHAMEPGVCIFKHVTGIPCPSCGSTRSVLSLLNGHFQEALFWNPLGLLLLLILLGTPIWMFYDLVSQRVTLLNAYTKTELFLKRKWVAIPAILLVLINWIWNISKGL